LRNWCRTQKRQESCSQRLNVLRLARRDHEDTPTVDFEARDGFAVALDVAGELRLPIIEIRTRDASVSAVMLMLKATVDEDD
jgi:hypothetical protein